MDNSTLRRKLVPVVLDWNIQPGTQPQFDASHYKLIQKGYVGSLNYGLNVRLPSTSNPKDKSPAPSTASDDLTTDTVSTCLAHYFNGDRSMNAGVGWQQADRAMCNIFSKILSNQGDIPRSMKDSIAAGRFRVLSNTAGLSGYIDTGSIGYDLSLSTMGYVWSLHNARGTGLSYSWGTTDMYHPDTIDEQNDGKARTGGPRYRPGIDTQQSVTLGDTVTLTPQWSAMFYLSQNWLQTENYDKYGSQTNQVDENGLSPNVAPAYKITPNTIVYVNHADSLEQGSITLADESIKNAGRTLNPYRNKQHEVGLKLDVGEMNLGATLFRLERPFAYLDTDNVYKEQGNRVSSGPELTTARDVQQGLGIYSGITSLDPKLKDAVNASTSNKQVVGMPKMQTNLLAEYSLPSIPEWVYSTNVRRTSKRAVNDINTSYASSYITWDLGTRYTTKVSNTPTTSRVVVNNVFDKHYWASIFSSGTGGGNDSPSAFIGGGRKICASVTFDFWWINDEALSSISAAGAAAGG